MNENDYTGYKTEEEQLAAELQGEFAQSTSDDRKQVDVFRQLMATSGWKLYEAFIHAQIQTRRDLYELSPTSTEFLRGEIAAMRLMIQLPRDIVESGRAAIEMRSEQLEEQLKQLKGS